MKRMSFIQGHLKGESVVVAILLSRMEVSYCTSGFFSELSPPNNFVKRELPFPRGLKSRTNIGYRAEWSRKIRRYNNPPPYVTGNMADAPTR